MMANEMGTLTRPPGRQELSVPSKNDHLDQKIFRAVRLRDRFRPPERC